MKDDPGLRGDRKRRKTLFCLKEAANMILDKTAAEYFGEIIELE
jgi:hypothetical protein